MVGVNQLALRHSLKVDVIEIDIAGIAIFNNVIDFFSVRLAVPDFLTIAAAVRVIIHELRGRFHRLGIFVVRANGVRLVDLEPL